MDKRHEEKFYPRGYKEDREAREEMYVTSRQGKCGHGEMSLHPNSQNCEKIMPGPNTVEDVETLMSHTVLAGM